MGARFTAHEDYQHMQAWARNEEGGSRLGATNRIEVLSRMELMAVTGASSTSGGAFVVNDRKAFLPLLRESAFTLGKVGQGETDSDTVEYVEQDGLTLHATAQGVAEGAARGETTVTYVVRTTPVVEMGHNIKATKRALADAGQLRTLLQGDLIEGQIRSMDLEVVSGDGAADGLTGIYNTSGIQTQALGALTRADALFKAITKIRIAFGEPDWIAFNPNDYEDLRLQKDGMGRYLFGDPSGVGSPTVWGIPWYQSTHITSGTPFVGDFRRGSTLWMREGLSVDATDSDGTDFVKRIVTLQANVRLAFKVVRPTHFATITGF
jgi:HK97 family phage major capsid protein